MSRLSELIAELCPNGVEHKKLGDIAKKHTERNAIGCEKVGTVSNKSMILVSSEEYYGNEVASADKSGYYIVERGWFVYNPSRINVGSIAYSDSCEPMVVSPMYVVFELNEDIINRQFFMYWLKTGVVKAKIENSVEISARFRMPFEKLSKFDVPCPPMDIQLEIVDILNVFASIQAELQAELELRSKQYEHYRDRLINSNNIAIPSVKITEVASIDRGKRVTREQIAGCSLYDVYQNSLTPLGKYDEYNCPENTTFLIAAGAAGEIGFSYEKFWAADDCYCFTCSESLDSRYLYHVLNNQQKRIASKVRRASIPRISRSDIENLVIPLPSLSVQKRLASVLDNFDAICSDLKIGLPAEMTLRQQQYEYYRDQLLTFAETGRIIFTDRQTDRQTDTIALKLIQYVFGYVNVKLGDIEELGLIKLGRGNVISKTDIRECPGDYPIYSSSATGNGEFGRYGKYMFDYPQISWSIDGGGRFFLRKDDKYSLTNVSGWLRVLDCKVINIDYLYYVLTNEWQNKTFDYTRKAHPSVIRDEYTVPLPPLKIQQEIVSILDKFSALVSDISIGLPAEIKLRQQQYEYYRDKLLSFKPISD